MKRIVIGGGCFWGVEAYYKRLKGVIDTNVGYANGNISNPGYEDLINKIATHVEACEIFYDEKIISLNMILEHLFRFIDPTSLNQQGEDKGIQYRTGVYYQSEEDKLVIDSFIHNQQKHYNLPIMVEVLPEKMFFLAEDYHQNYLDVNPNGYCHVDLNLIKTNELK